jgi:large subunit ribosomal protein L10
MQRLAKEEAVTALRSIFNDSSVVVMWQHQGLTVEEMEKVRGRARELGGGFKVTKNRLAKIAIEGTGNACLKDKFKGQTGIFYGNDVVSTTKAAVEMAKDYKDRVKVEGASYEERFLSKEEVEVLSSLPSMEVLQSRIVGLLQAPMAKMLRVLTEPSSKVARVLTMKPSDGGGS